MQYQTSLLFGPPGSGKGTQGKLLAQVSGNYHLSSGDIFRTLSPASEMGRIFYGYASKGKLVPDAVTIDVCCTFIKGLIDTNRFFPEEQQLILDGIPRTQEQAKGLEEHLVVQKIFVLELSDEKAIERLQKRAFLEGRGDDKESTVLQHRLQVYKETTMEVIGYYEEKKKNIISINGDQTKGEVFRDIINSYY